MPEDYIGTAELYNDNELVKRQLESVAYNFKNKEKISYASQLKEIAAYIKNKINGEFKVIILKTFNSVFRERYGDNFDPKVLESSLTFCNEADGVSPSIKYNVKDFTLTKDFIKQQKAFNQNADPYFHYSDLIPYEELEELEEDQYYGLLIGEESPYDLSEDESFNIEDMFVFHRNTVIRDPKEVYKEAETLALKEYNKQCKQRVYPEILTVINTKLKSRGLNNG